MSSRRMADIAGRPGIGVRALEEHDAGDGTAMRSLRNRPGTPEPAYEVGYGKPPERTRFKPGQSGNPLGRPKGARAKKHSLPALNEERLKTVVLEEAYRHISVRDGERLVEIPVIQAIMRTVALNAAKGDRRSQNMFAQMLQWVERENKELHERFLGSAIDYKLDWERELERRKRTGDTGPEPLPHPDDIVIDMQTGLVDIRGPMTKEQKADLEKAREWIQDGKELITRIEAKLKRKPHDESLKRSLEHVRRTHRRIFNAVPEWVAAYIDS